MGKQLEWSELELDVIERAAATADRAEVVRAVFDAERAGDARPTVLVSLSGELRLLDKTVVDLLSRLEFRDGKAKSDRHQRAANYRWNREA
ncbi:hypothetical protein AU197_14460 [Mycobacterium sp. IS-1590]|nr:hypothetical protein AU197_14460 [Mycobacterium sp. IS-1590]